MAEGLIALAAKHARQRYRLYDADLPEYAAASPGVRENVDALRPVSNIERIERDSAWAAKLALISQ